MAPTGAQALPFQLVAQHVRTHERMYQVQLVDSSHERQVGIADRSRQVVHRAPADAQQFRLSHGASRVYGRSSLCAQRSRLGERALQIIILNR